MAVIRGALPDDAAAVAEYLDARLGDGRATPDLFHRLFAYRWMADKPNIGYLVEHDGRFRGFVGGIYSQREIRGRRHSFCNIHSFAVDEAFRHMSLSMLKTLLERPECTYTCFSASPPVVQILTFFRFQTVDATNSVFQAAAGLARL